MRETRKHRRWKKEIPVGISLGARLFGQRCFISSWRFRVTFSSFLGVSGTSWFGDFELTVGCFNYLLWKWLKSCWLPLARQVFSCAKWVRLSEVSKTMTKGKLEINILSDVFNGLETIVKHRREHSLLSLCGAEKPIGFQIRPEWALQVLIE